MTRGIDLGAGRGVRVGVIDSGVNPKHPHIVSLAGGVSIDSGDDIPESYLDLLGHGTAVMAAIQEKAPEAEYFAVKVFHRSLSTTAGSLLKAIEWCIEHEMHVINLSLGTPNSEHAASLADLVERATERQIVLVSARETNGRPYFPGCLPGVVGVAVDWECDRDSYRGEQTATGPIFYASGYPRPVPGVPAERNLHGISFAVANMTGFVIRACALSSCRSLEVITSTLFACLPAPQLNTHARAPLQRVKPTV
jgi:subtilisin family serine protease